MLHQKLCSPTHYMYKFGLIFDTRQHQRNLDKKKKKRKEREISSEKKNVFPQTACDERTSNTHFAQFWHRKVVP